jgi:hypothetical protein
VVLGFWAVSWIHNLRSEKLKAQVLWLRLKALSPAPLQVAIERKIDLVATSISALGWGRISFAAPVSWAAKHLFSCCLVFVTTVASVKWGSARNRLNEFIFDQLKRIMGSLGDTKVETKIHGCRLKIGPCFE